MLEARERINASRMASGIPSYGKIIKLLHMNKFQPALITIKVTYQTMYITVYEKPNFAILAGDILAGHTANISFFLFTANIINQPVLAT